MIARRSLLAVAAAAAFLTSCGRMGSPNAFFPTSTLPSVVPHGCYKTLQKPQTVSATITFYGWPDNAPPGNAIAHPVIHKGAGGDGTWCNPTTFATEPSYDKRIPYGIKIYVPFLKQYFVREDDCTTSGPSSGSGSNGCYGLWFDLWIGGDKASNKKAVFRCERMLTPSKQVSVILYPKSTMPVAHAGAIYRDAPPPNGTCDGTVSR